MSRDYLEPYEKKALYALASRAQKEEHKFNWYIEDCDNNLVVHKTCLICHEKMVNNQHIVAGHGRRHIKERNLTGLL
jgi:hypothetical protein